MKKKILIVEDIELHQELLIQVLEQDYDVITAFDGVEGIQFARQEQPDLILMDLSLPKVNGWEATRRIRLIPELLQVPIIALLTQMSQNDLEMVNAAGYDGYLTKPIKAELLDTILAKYLG